MKLLCCLVVALLFEISVTEAGIKCWKCENQGSNEACRLFGSLVQCLPHQFHCQNEIRSIGGRRFEITKRCKQDFGCTNNKIQNFTGSVPFQCATEEPHSVCRCCCGFDNCNGPEVSCMLAPPKCEKPDAPLNGRVYCPANLVVGATCYYECFGGYKMVGSFSTKCELLNDQTTGWSNPPPICEEAKCSPPLDTPENGIMSCTNAENIGSVCSFTCVEPYFLVGPTDVSCTEWGLWSDLPPVCIDVPCKKPMPNDPHRTETCTDLYNQESVCSYVCDAAYDLVGVSAITCGVPVINKRGQWDNPAPTCDLGECRPDLSSEADECTNGNFVGSVCSYTCPAGEYMRAPDGTVVLTYQRQCMDDRSWTGGTPTCDIITCIPPSSDPTNGLHQCDDGNRYNSRCDYQCVEGYDLVGTPSRECKGDGTSEFGAWSAREPTCTRGRCPAVITRVDIVCTEENFVGSVCTLRCEPNEYMTSSDGTLVELGSLTIECLVDKTWSDGPPTCNPITCQPPAVAPGDGSVSCDDRNNIGSTCGYRCRSGYRMEGEADRVCENDGDGDETGRWDPANEPTCIRDECPAIVTTLDIVCTEENFVGSVCTLACKANEYMRNSDGTLVEAGSLATECLVDTTWSEGPPTCHPKTCEPPAVAPGNGSVSCDNRNNIGSTCGYQCLSGYRMEGDADRVCRNDGDGDETGRWDPANPPICIPDTCEDFTTRGITKFCTNANNVGSVCDLVCDDEDSELIGNDKVECTMPPGGGDPDWDPRLNARCEKMRCPPFPAPGQMPSAEAGTLTCSNLDTNPPIGTRCDLTCNLGYQAKDKVVRSTCVEKDKWDFPEICCVNCLINPALDVVVLLDTSESIAGVDIWKLRTDFVVDFADFLVDQSFTFNITIIPFGGDVDLANAIDFTTIDPLNPAERLRAELNNLPYSGTGPSNSGKALDYVEREVFDGFSEFRVPMVFLLTSARPRDLALGTRTAGRMRERLIHVRVIPLTDDKVADAGGNTVVLENLASDPEYVVYAPLEDNPDDFFDTASLDLVTVTSYLCNSQEQHTANCIFEDPFFPFFK